MMKHVRVVIIRIKHVHAEGSSHKVFTPNIMSLTAINDTGTHGIHLSFK